MTMEQTTEQTDVQEEFDFENVQRLLDLRDDLEIDGVPVWEAIERDTGLSRKAMEELQAKHVKKNGRPKPLYMVELINDTFIVRQLTQGDQRYMIELTNHMTSEKKKELGLGPNEELPESELIFIEYYVTTSTGVVWPEDFDPADEDNTISTLSWLYTTITNISGLNIRPDVKKV